MAKDNGTFKIGGNFKVEKEGAWDSRTRVTAYADLLSFTAQDYIGLGHTVDVYDADQSKRGSYMCINKNDLANPASWEKQTGAAGGSNLGPLVDITPTATNQTSFSIPNKLLKNTDNLYRNGGIVPMDARTISNDGTNSTIALAAGVNPVTEAETKDIKSFQYQLVY